MVCKYFIELRLTFMEAELENFLIPFQTLLLYFSTFHAQEEIFTK
jgi:hypothetical protein